MSKTPSRIYRIDDGRKDRLVRATSQAQAIRHVASGFAVRVATQDDIVSLMSEGVTVEGGAEARSVAEQTFDAIVGNDQP